MEFNPFAAIAVLWVILSLFRRVGQGGGSSPERPESERPPPRPGTPTSHPDSTQQEGSRLEELFRDLDRNLEGRTRGVDEDEDVEEPETLEEEPVVVSLETEVVRPERVVIDRDRLATRAAARRIAEVTARNRARTAADHRALDRRIREEVAPIKRKAAPAYTPRQLREAVVWREILGLPVGLRRDPVSLDPERR